MAQFPIDIKIDTSDSNKLGPLNRQLNETDKSATGAATATRALSAAIATVALAAGIGQLVKLSDSYTKIQNSIVNVVSSTQELTQRTGELLRVANQSRSSFEATAALYGKLKRATDELGISQDRVLRITDLINKGFIASGATGQEAANAVTQLAQGLASGTLRGDEFNSVAEQAPVILRAVSQETGKTIGQLREFAAQGGITADILIKSIEGYGDTIDREFARTATTFDQQSTVARNLATEWVGSSDAIRQASAAAGAVLVTLAENLDTVAAVGGTIATVYGVRVVQSLVASTAAMVAQTTASRALAAAMALLGGPAGVAILAGSALLYFADSAAEAAKATQDTKLAEEINTLVTKYKELNDEGKRITFDKLEQEASGLRTQLQAANDEYSRLKKIADDAAKTGTGFAPGASELAAAGEASARAAALSKSLDDVVAKQKAVAQTAGPVDTAWKSLAAGAASAASFYDELKLKLEQQIALIGLTEVEQARLQARQELLNKATKEGVKLTEAQIQAYTDLAAQAVVEQQRAEADKYILSLGRQVAAEREIGLQAQVNANLGRLSASATAEQRAAVEALTQSLYAQQEAERSATAFNEVRQIGVAAEDPLAKLQAEEDAKREILFNSYYEKSMMEEAFGLEYEEYQQRLLNLDTEYAAKRSEIQFQAQQGRINAERAQQAQLLGITSGIFDQLADKIEESKGKESAAYKAAFIASKAAAIAQAVIQTELAATTALAPPPFGLGPVAGLPYSQVIRGLGYASIGLMAGQAVAGFKDGGYVSGAGTGRSDSIPATLSNGEYVMPAARTDQYRSELDAMRRGTYSGAMPTASGNRVTINNYASDVASVSVAEGPDGELIATIDRRIAEQTPGVMAEQAADPYSKFNRSINSQYVMERR